jgi:hypothetical protein
VKLSEAARTLPGAMQSVTEAIAGRIEAEREFLREFLLEHSCGLRDLNTPDSSVFIMGPSRAWADLSQDGRRLQSRLLEVNGDAFRR